jgi:hypothetical protein
MRSSREFAFDKVALFALHKSLCPRPVPANLWGFDDWTPTHMARQLPDETWSSKCGGYEDIRHYTLDAMESYFHPGAYGCPVLYMKRFVPISWGVRLFQFLLWRAESIAEKCKLLFHLCSVASLTIRSAF